MFNQWRDLIVAACALLSIVIHLTWGGSAEANFTAIILRAILLGGGSVLLIDIIREIRKRGFGADILAITAIITALLQGHDLAGVLVVLMLSGGRALERFAMEHASAVLRALASRMPQTATRRTSSGTEEIALEQIAVGDIIVVPPHEICPVDGIVTEGSGSMDESFLTGEPLAINKAPGLAVISGAMNGESLLVIQARALARESRFSRIVEVTRQTAEGRVPARRIADSIGAWFTPAALIVACLAWVISSDATRFLAVLVVATPCPLLIAVPVAIIGAVSCAARRNIIIRNPAILEQLTKCSTVVLDKTGTLTYGTPRLDRCDLLSAIDENTVVQLAASLEQYSQHPLARAFNEAAKMRGLPLLAVSELSQQAGVGLQGTIGVHHVLLTSRSAALRCQIPGSTSLPPTESGLECLVALDGTIVACCRFEDQARAESPYFINHLASRHHVTRVLLVSGDRKAAVEALAKRVGISEIYSETSPEQKVSIVREASKRGPTVFIGDGINDAPALLAASAGIAFGHQSDITSQAAGAVILDSSIERIDELFHIAHFTRSVLLQSAVGGMVLSAAAMVLAAAGLLNPIAGAIVQEIIDLFAVLNALRTARGPKRRSDFPQPQ